MPRTKQFDRDEVLEKAKDLFWKQGFHATSMQDLVDHLGINRASLYDTFGGKNELYEAAFRLYRAENAAQLKKKLTAFPSVRAGIKALLQTVVQSTLEDPDRKGCFVVNCTTEYLPDHQHILADLLDNKMDFQDILAEALQRGKDTGEFSPQMDTRQAAVYLYTFFSGLKVISKVQQDPEELERTVELGLKVLD